jgi:hypothetical protein
MDMLSVTPDQFTLELAMHIKEGAEALAAGFGKLATTPAAASADADRARKAERRAEKSYRRALAALFNGDDFINMFKRREIYRHLSNAADRIAADGDAAMNRMDKRFVRSVSNRKQSSFHDTRPIQQDAPAIRPPVAERAGHTLLFCRPSDRWRTTTGGLHPAV